VSLVLSNAPGARIASATRARVVAVADDLGYRRDLVASGLRRSRTDTIGLVSEGIATTPRGWAMVAGAQEAAWERGRVLLVANTGGEATHEHDAMENLLDRRVDGLVLGATYHRALPVPPLRAPVPVVLLDAFDPHGGHPAVVPDDEHGAHQATALLLEAGHERVAFINSADPVPASRLRLAGYRAALAGHGVGFDESLVIDAADADLPDGGRHACEALLDRDVGFTGLFCFNDRVASGAYRALRRAGLTVPADVSVVGFDDQADVADALDPPLTTIALPHEAMGRWAVNRLLDRIDGVEGADEPQLRLEPCPPVLRDSVTTPG
jgi:LacI family transcriptional regulator